MSESLLDDLLPRFDVRSIHATRVAAPAALVYETARSRPLPASPIVTSLMWLRTLPSRFRGRRPDRKSSPTTDAPDGFTLLAERDGREFVLGVVGQFWTVVPKMIAVEAGAFPGFHDERYAKAAWSFAVSTDERGTILSTETRVQCPTKDARVRFLRYWRLIGPFSGLIRCELLRAIRRNAERAVRRVQE